MSFEKGYKKFKELYGLGEKNEIFNILSYERIHPTNDKRLKNIVDWYHQCVEQCSMSYTVIPLDECKMWSFDKSSGSIVHDSGEFFRIDGIRVHNSKEREVIGGWDQPILTQYGYDGGILGLIRKVLNGIPHYLVEAKSEPGNYNIVQITTTVQATFSNLKQAHKGSKTRFSEYFLEPEKFGCNVILKRWMSEDGGRLLNKRNLSMLVDIPHEVELNVPDTYKWVTLWELVQLTRHEDAIISPHIRGVISAL
ncbi:NDP-hexose 2,3-dehydratase family protein [Vibrio lentus]